MWLRLRPRLRVWSGLRFELLLRGRRVIGPSPTPVTCFSSCVMTMTMDDSARTRTTRRSTWAGVTRGGRRRRRRQRRRSALGCAGHRAGGEEVVIAAGGAAGGGAFAHAEVADVAGHLAPLDQMAFRAQPVAHSWCVLLAAPLSGLRLRWLLLWRRRWASSGSGSNAANQRTQTRVRRSSWADRRG